MYKSTIIQLILFVLTYLLYLFDQNRQCVHIFMILKLFMSFFPYFPIPLFYFLIYLSIMFLDLISLLLFQLLFLFFLLFFGLFLFKLMIIFVQIYFLDSYCLTVLIFKKKSFLFQFMLSFFYIQFFEKQKNNKNSIMQQQGELNKYFQQISYSKFYQRYINLQEVGSGAGSIVYKANDLYHQNRDVAIKFYNKQQLSYYCREDIIRQITILRSIQDNTDADYFVGFYGSFMITKQGSWMTDYCLVLQFCHSTLTSLISNKKTLLSIPENDRIKICLKIARGVKFLHSRNILHRDLKPDNILLNNNQFYQPYISDFGHSKQKTNYMSRLRGTPLYADPFLQQQQDYGFQWDIYSFGLIFLEIMSGSYLIKFPSQKLPPKKQFYLKMKQALRKIQDTLKSFEIRQEIKKIIQFCLIPGNTRWTIHKVVEQLEKIIKKIDEQDTKTPKSILSIQSTKEKESRSQNKISMKQIEIPIQNNITKSLQVTKQQTLELKRITQSLQQQQKKNEQPENLLKLKKTFSIEQFYPENKIQQKNQLFQSFTSSNQQFHSIYLQQSILLKSQKSELIKQNKIINQQMIKSNLVQTLKKSYKSQNNQLRLKLISTKIHQQKKINTHNDHVVNLEKLKKYQRKLQNIKQLQKLSISNTIKKQLIILAFIHFKIRIKSDLKKFNGDQFMIKNINKLEQKIKILFNPLLVEMKKKQFSFRVSARKLLDSQDNIDCSYVKTQIQHIIRSECPLDKTAILFAIQ